MNIFNIPRVFKVSGFGKWSMGQQSLCTAFISLYWVKFQRCTPERRDRLVTLAITHDLHEVVTGDILPFFKTEEVKKIIVKIQKDILDYFEIEKNGDLKKELKLLDMVSFLYGPPASVRQEKIRLLNVSTQFFPTSAWNEDSSDTFQVIEWPRGR